MKKTGFIAFLALACVFAVIMALAFIACDTGNNNIDGDGDSGDGSTAAEITITFNPGNGTVTPTSITGKADTTITLPTPVNNGYVFTGWYSTAPSAADKGTRYGNEENRYTLSSFEPPAITMFARWTVDTTLCRITFHTNTNGGSVTPASINEYKGETITLPTPVFNGYVFDGWYSSFSPMPNEIRYGGGGDSFVVATTYSSDYTITMSARWSVARTITFIAGEGSDVEPVIAGHNSVITLPVPTRDGYGLEGWYSAEQGGTRYGYGYGGDTYTVTTDITMYARWAVLCTITLDAQGGSVTPESVTGMKGSRVSIPSPSWAEHICKGWYSEPEGGTKYDDINYTITGDVTMYAQWWPLYIVTFDAHGGTVTPALMYVTEWRGGSTTITLPADPTRYGYVFEGWYSEAAGGRRYGGAGDLYTASGDIMLITMHAQWRALPLYTVTFDPNGAPSAPGPIAEYEGLPITLPGITKDGYTFNGWFSEAEGGTSYGNGGSNYTASGDVTMYARWTINQYTITFNANGGTVTPASCTDYYAAVITLPVPTRTGYRFYGWYDVAIYYGGTKYGDSGDSYTIPASDVTMYARWIINQYTITFNANGGTVTPAPRTINYDTSTRLPADLTKEGYTFNGWFSAAEGGDEYGDSGGYYTIPANDVEMYAQWTINRTITFSENGGSSVAPVTVPDGSAITLPVPTRNGYTFNGWFSEAEGGTKYGDGGGTYTVTGDITMHAQWAINCTVRFNTSLADIAPITVPAGTTINLPGASHPAAVFKGWYSEPNGGGILYGLDRARYTVTGNVTMYAKWQDQVGW